MFLNHNSPLLEDKMVSEYTKCKICGKDISETQVLNYNGVCTDCTCITE